MEEVREYKRGQVYYVRYDNSIGSETAVGRPVLIISADEKNEVLDTVVVALLSGTPRNSKLCVKVRTLHKWSHVLCTQLQTADKKRLSDYMCTLEEYEMLKVDNCLRYNLGLMDDKTDIEENDDDNIDLKTDLEMYKKMYEKTMDKLVELKMEMAMATKTTTEPIKAVEVEVVEKPQRVQKVAEVAPVKKRTGKININTATRQEIRDATGMNYNACCAIVKTREDYGPYTSVDDLLEVKHFGTGCMKKYGYLFEV